MHKIVRENNTKPLSYESSKSLNKYKEVEDLNVLSATLWCDKKWDSGALT